MNNKSIGVFDSGIGGLTVLQKLTALLPQENFCYLADLKYFPYGQKSSSELQARLVQIINFFVKMDVKMLVIACNTASLFASDLQKFCSFPIVDVINPTCKSVQRVTQNNRVCLLATRQTVDSGAYQRKLQSVGIDCCAIACPELVTIAESGNIANSFEIVQQKLQWANGVCDTVIHGCTHFEILQEIMSKVLPNATFVNCGEPTSHEVSRCLQRKNLQQDGSSNGKVTIFTTARSQHLLERLPYFGFGNCSVSNVSV